MDLKNVFLFFSDRFSRAWTRFILKIQMNTKGYYMNYFYITDKNNITSFLLFFSNLNYYLFYKFIEKNSTFNYCPSRDSVKNLKLPVVWSSFLWAQWSWSWSRFRWWKWRSCWRRHPRTGRGCRSCRRRNLRSAEAWTANRNSSSPFRIKLSFFFFVEKMFQLGR